MTTITKQKLFKTKLKTQQKKNYILCDKCQDFFISKIVQFSFFVIFIANDRKTLVFAPECRPRSYYQYFLLLLLLITNTLPYVYFSCSFFTAMNISIIFFRFVFQYNRNSLTFIHKNCGRIKEMEPITKNCDLNKRERNKYQCLEMIRIIIIQTNVELQLLS